MMQFVSLISLFLVMWIGLTTIFLALDVSPVVVLVVAGVFGVFSVFDVLLALRISRGTNRVLQKRYP